MTKKEEIMTNIYKDMKIHGLEREKDRLLWVFTKNESVPTLDDRFDLIDFCNALVYELTPKSSPIRDRDWIKCRLFELFKCPKFGEHRGYFDGKRKFATSAFMKAFAEMDYHNEEEIMEALMEGRRDGRWYFNSQRDSVSPVKIVGWELDTTYVI